MSLLSVSKNLEQEQNIGMKINGRNRKEKEEKRKGVKKEEEGRETANEKRREREKKRNASSVWTEYGSISEGVASFGPE